MKAGAIRAVTRLAPSEGIGQRAFLDIADIAVAVRLAPAPALGAVIDGEAVAEQQLAVLRRLVRRAARASGMRPTHTERLMPSA